MSTVTLFVIESASFTPLTGIFYFWWPQLVGIEAVANLLAV